MRLYQGMDRPTLDAAYNNAAAVADSADLVASWAERSAAFRKDHPGLLNQAYGPAPRQKMDLFRCGAVGAPCFLFIHGGYWQRNAKEGFAVMAQGPMALGFDVAVVGYTLAPEARLSAIVGEIAAAIAWLRRRGPELGLDLSKLIVGGWSAGGHLTASAMGLPGVDAGLSVSGVFELEPIRLSYLNEKLRLDEAEADLMSPMRHVPAQAGPLTLAYGAAELPELRRQSEAFAAAWIGAGRKGELLPLANENHFTILDHLIDPKGALCEALSALRAAS
jgi:acetyl esterase/lipase